MFDLYYDWSKSKVGKLDMEGAYEMAIEAHYTKPNDEDAQACFQINACELSF